MFRNLLLAAGLSCLTAASASAAILTYSVDFTVDSFTGEDQGVALTEASALAAFGVQTGSSFDVSVTFDTEIDFPSVPDGPTVNAAYLDTAALNAPFLSGPIMLDPNNSAIAVQVENGDSNLTFIGATPELGASLGEEVTLFGMTFSRFFDTDPSDPVGFPTSSPSFFPSNGGMTINYQEFTCEQAVCAFGDLTTQRSIEMTFNEPSITVTSADTSAVPLPAGVWLLGAALGGLGLARRRA